MWFSAWSLASGIQPPLAFYPGHLGVCAVPSVLGLVLSSLRMHLAAISVFHPPNQGRSVFSSAKFLLCRMASRSRLFTSSFPVGVGSRVVQDVPFSGSLASAKLTKLWGPGRIDESGSLLTVRACAFMTCQKKGQSQPMIMR